MSSIENSIVWTSKPSLWYDQETPPPLQDRKYDPHSVVWSQGTPYIFFRSPKPKLPTLSILSMWTSICAFLKIVGQSCGHDSLLYTMPAAQALESAMYSSNYCSRSATEVLCVLSSRERFGRQIPKPEVSRYNDAGNFGNHGACDSGSRDEKDTVD